jgi:hypothetical protein
VRPTKHLEEGHNVYDLTRAFIEKTLYFPFAPHGDLIDACARIYDMKPVAPAELGTRRMGADAPGCVRLVPPSLTFVRYSFSMEPIDWVERRPPCRRFVPNTLHATVRSGDGRDMASLEGNQITTAEVDVVDRGDDRFLWGFPLFAIGCEIFLAALSYLERVDGSFIVTLSFFFLIALGMTVVALVGIVALIKNKFKRAASLLLASFIVASPFLFPVAPYEEFAFDWLRFLSTKEKYVQVIDRMSPAERASRIVSFDWGEEELALAAIAISHHRIVYDESGEIALPEQERSQAWKARAERDRFYFSRDEKCLVVIRRLDGHYYSVAKRCPQ